LSNRCESLHENSNANGIRVD